MFADDSSTCHRCGHDARLEKINASTWRIAISIAEVMTGKRKLHEGLPKNRHKH